MLVGVSGGGEGGEAQPAQVDLVPVLQPTVREGPPPGRGRQQDRAELVCELAAAGQEVRVQVGVGRDADGEAVLAGEPEEGTQIPRGIDGERGAVTEVEQVAGVAQPLVDDQVRGDPGGRGGHRTSDPRVATTLRYSRYLWSIQSRGEGEPCHG
ncbi:MAG: hypothetical protein AB7J32_16850 [Pseudonocardia sp.]